MRMATKFFAAAACIGVVSAGVVGCSPWSHKNHNTTVPIQKGTGTFHAAAHRVEPPSLRPLDMSHLNVDLSHHVYYKNKVVVVSFHDISPDVYSPYVITPQAFSADLDAFHRRFNVITNRQFISFLDGAGSVPPNAVLLTFDDGYRNMYTYALPILLQHQMQGTFFDIVGTADSKSPNEFLNWDQIKAMVHDGMAVESHTYMSHYEVADPYGRRIPVFNTRIVVHGTLETPQQYHHRVYADFVRARLELSQKTGEPGTEFAWPYGYGTPVSTFIAHQAGYRYLFTTADGAVWAGSTPSFIHRIDVGRDGVTPDAAVEAVLRTANLPPVVYRIAHRQGGAEHSVKPHTQTPVVTGRPLLSKAHSGFVAGKSLNPTNANMAAANAVVAKTTL